MGDIVVFDIETKESFDDVGGWYPERLNPSLVGVYSFQKDQFIGFTEDEFDRLWPIFNEADLIIGFNSEGFDIPVLKKLYPPLAEIQSLDMLRVIKDSAGFRVKLDSLAAGTLGTKKSADGLEAIKMYREGRLEELRSYCLKDVEITRDVYLYGKEHGHVKAASLMGEQVITVDFNPAITPKEAQVLSLGL